jgi:HK97 family phage portal protein
MKNKKSMPLSKRLQAIFKPEIYNDFLSDMSKQFMSGEDVTYYPQGNQLATSTVFACSRVLAETFACIPVFEYRKTPDGREKTDKTGLLDILHNRPNEFMSGYNFFESCLYQIINGGNSISIRQFNRYGDLIGLIPVMWDRVRIQFNKEKTSYTYIVDGRTEYTRDQVLHVPGPSLDGINGMSVLEYAAQSIALSIQYDRFGLQVYKNGLSPSGVFEHPSHFSDEEWSRFTDRLKKQYTGDKAGTPLLLEDGLKYNQLQIKLSDAEFLASRKFQVEEICRFFRVPLHMIQSLDRATYSNIEQQSLEFAQYGLLPYCKRFEQAINTQLLTSEQRSAGYYFEFNLSALVRGDIVSRYNAYNVGRQAGFMSVNEIRELENLPRIENGDRYLEPLNMVEAGAVQAVNDSSAIEPAAADVENYMKANQV